MSNDSSKPLQPAELPNPDKKGVTWGPLSAVLVTILAFVGAQFFAGALLAFGFGRDQAWLNTITGQFIFVLISDVLIVCTLGLFLRSRKATLKMLGFGRRPTLGDAGRAMLAFVLYFLALIVITSVLSNVTGFNANQKQELGFDNLFTAPERLMALVSLVILPPFIEETVFHGFLFGGLRKRFTFVWAALITSVLFAAPHLLESSQGLLWVGGVDTFVLSLVLCYLRERTGALWASIFVHGIKNGLALALLIFGSRFLGG